MDKVYLIKECRSYDSCLFAFKSKERAEEVLSLLSKNHYHIQELEFDDDRTNEEIIKILDT